MGEKLFIIAKYTAAQFLISVSAVGGKSSVWAADECALDRNNSGKCTFYLNISSFSSEALTDALWLMSILSGEMNYLHEIVKSGALFHILIFALRSSS